MKLLKKIPFFLFLLVLFFCLHGSLENYGYISAGEVAEVGLTALLCITVLFGICWLLTGKNYLPASLICFFIALWYMFFGAIHDWVRNIEWLYLINPYSAMIPVLIVCTIAFVYILKRYTKLQPRLFFYLNILMVIYCLVDGYLILNKSLTAKRNTAPSNTSFDISKVKARPNVYVLLFDCYAGYTSLQDSFDYKNDSLYSFLAQRSFKILPAFSNYNFTFFSMASMFNMQYITEDYQAKVAVQEDMQKRVNEIRNGEVFSIFSSMQYNIENYSIFDIKQMRGVSKTNTIVPMHSYLITNKIFHNRLILDLGYLFYKINYFNRKHIFEHDIDNKTAYDKTMATIERAGASPKFVYAHFLMPHAPYFKDSLGNYLPVSQFNVGSKKNYLSYLKYTNKIIKEIITKITTYDPQAIVLLTSDHGYNDKGTVRRYGPAQIAAEQYSFNSICAVRFPDKQFDVDRPVISNVNIFRYLFNSQFGQQFPYLKDSTVWVNHD